MIALDQLPRNLFRGTPRAFAYDAWTAGWCLAADRILDAEIPRVGVVDG